MLHFLAAKVCRDPAHSRHFAVDSLSFAANFLPAYGGAISRIVGYNQPQWIQQKAKAMRLILASSSPRRRRLLQQIGINFEVMKPQIDESRRPGEALTAYVERLSRQKAAAVIAMLADEPAIVIAADTIVVLQADPAAMNNHDELLGKPGDADDARRMLKQLRNRRHQVCTAFTVYKTAPPQTITAHVRTDVYMRDYSDAEIEAYIVSRDPFDKAGGYAIQNQIFRPVARIEGSYTNVVGLPLDELQAALTKLGFSLSPKAGQG